MWLRASSHSASSPDFPDCPHGVSAARYAGTTRPAIAHCHPSSSTSPRSSAASIAAFSCQPPSFSALISSEGICHALQFAAPLDDDVERDATVSVLPADCEPRVGRVPDPADLLRCHHLERVAETRAGLGLDLSEAVIGT